MPTIIGIQHVVALNAELADAKLPAKVHLHDACGGQTLTLELFSPTHPAVNKPENPANLKNALNADKNQSLLSQVQGVVRTYLASQGIRVEFDTLTGTTFRAI